MSGQTFNPSLVYDTDEFALGQELQDESGERWMFVEADEALTVNRVCVINTDYGAELVDKNALTRGLWVGVCKTAIPNGKFGWLSRKGQGPIQCTATVAAHARLYTTGTSGSVNDASSSQEEIYNIFLTEARGGSAGTAKAIWEYPTG